MNLLLSLLGKKFHDLKNKARIDSQFYLTMLENDLLSNSTNEKNHPSYYAVPVHSYPSFNRSLENIWAMGASNR